MPRLLRIYLVGCIAVAYVYLVWHAREPLRLNVGDPWSDASMVSSVESIRQYGFRTDPVNLDPLVSPAYRPTHLPPLPEIVYGALGKLGISDIAAFRFVALVLAALATWLLHAYARRIWSAAIALIATALFSTSVLWMMYADSLQRLPLVYAFCFLALWGLARSIETQQRRHYAAAVAGSFACFMAGYDAWPFLLGGVLFTVAVKLGKPLAPANRRFVILGISGAAAAIVVRWLLDMGPVEWHAGPVEWLAAVDSKLDAPFPTLLRRYSLAFTPMFWITLLYTVWRAVRAPSLAAALRDAMIWTAGAAAIFFLVSSQRSASPLLRAQPLLPFYAIGSALLIAQFLDGGRIRRALAFAWLAVAPVWAFVVLFSHPRAVLDRDDVARVRTYLAVNDRNDFVMSNLLSDGPIHAAFDRHSWPVPEADEDLDTHPMLLWMLETFEITGTDYAHAVIFTTPDSRFVDRSVGQLLMRRRLASVTGWPYLVRSKANGIIADYDKRVHRTLEAVGAKPVLRLRNFDLYRIDLATVLDVAGRAVPVVRELDLSSLAADKHKLLGWGAARLTDEDRIGASSIDGHSTCDNPIVERRAGELSTHACGTVLTKRGLQVLDVGWIDRAQLLIRVDRACDLRVTLDLAAPSRLSRLLLKVASSSLLRLSMNDFTAWQCDPATRLSYVIPQRSVRDGINLLTFDKKRFGPLAARADVRSIAIEPQCEPTR
jgi:hypothetical protein